MERVYTVCRHWLYDNVCSVCLHSFTLSILVSVRAKGMNCKSDFFVVCFLVWPLCCILILWILRGMHTHTAALSPSAHTQIDYILQ